MALLPYLAADNPYLRLLADSLRSKGVEVRLVRGVGLKNVFDANDPIDVLHIQWHHRLFVPRSGRLAAAVRQTVLAFLRLAVLRRKGVRVVWTVHNVVNHEQQLRRWEIACCRRLARSVDAIIVHCAEARDIVSLLYRVSPESIRIVPHGHYMDWYPEPDTRQSARLQWDLEPSDRVLLFFGQIRDYKGVNRLLEAFATVPGEDLRLVVAGSPRTETMEEVLVEQAAADGRVRLHLEFLDEERLVSCITASDLVVLPYSDSLTSGAAIMASSLGRPLLMPRIGCMGEFPSGAAFLYDQNDPTGLEDAIRAVSLETLDVAGEEAKEYVTSFNWDMVGDMTLAVYENSVG